MLEGKKCFREKKKRRVSGKSHAQRGVEIYEGWSEQVSWRWGHLSKTLRR